MKYGKHHKIVSNKSVRNKNVSQSNIKNNKCKHKKSTKVVTKTINPTMWKVKIITILIILLCMFNINGIVSYFSDIAMSINEFSIEANYVVTFDSNTGTGTMNPQKISYNVATNLTENAYTKNGYTFDGWNTDANGHGVAYSNGQSVTNIENITLYAQWNMETYNIGYTLNDGTVATENPDTYNIETTSFTLNNPNKTGYIFKGWSGTGLNGDTNTEVTIEQGSTGDRNYIANYTANTYYIKFNANGGSNSMQNQTLTYDTQAKLTANNFTRTGYIFTGWNTESNGNGTSYGNKAEVSNLTTTNGDIINLYAQWELQNTRYAVQIYGINQDVDANGNTLGLTFGPAVGANYNNSYVTHEYEKTSEGSGEYYVKIVTHTVAANGSETTSSAYLTDSSSNNVIRTQEQVAARENISLHDMTWAQIKAVQDKTVFEDCMLCGDTKCVGLALNDTIASGKEYNQYGDGAGMLLETIMDTTGAHYKVWNPNYNQNTYVGTGGELTDNEIKYGSNAKEVGGYSVSHIRATLIGKNEKTNEIYAGDVNLTGDTCLYSCIESDLQSVITPKKIKYVTGRSTTNYNVNDDIADPIWLFSDRELCGTGNDGGDEKEGIGENGDCYDKFGKTESKYYISSYNTNENPNRACYSEKGVVFYWWLRSLRLNYTDYARSVRSNGGINNAGAYYTYGISFGFCIR